MVPLNGDMTRDLIGPGLAELIEVSRPPDQARAFRLDDRWLARMEREGVDVRAQDAVRMDEEPIALQRRPERVLSPTQNGRFEIRPESHRGRAFRLAEPARLLGPYVARCASERIPIDDGRRIGGAQMPPPRVPGELIQGHRRLLAR